MGNVIMVKLSKASKMPCRSWSLQALVTCPASKDAYGNLVPACAGCYATTGNYNFPNVKAPRAHNQLDWKRFKWVEDMVAELDADRYFRWFDSGDMYDVRLAQKILEVMRLTPWVRHWLPTRMHKFDKFASVIAEMEALPNVVVRLSSDSITGEVISGATTSTIIPTIEDASHSVTVCMAYERDGKCGSCRACWSKDVSVVAYVAHGRKMERNLIKLKEVA
jgi:hypothetical protein